MLIIVSILIFLIMHFLPGDPLLMFLARGDLNQVTEENLNALRHEFGLDKPIPIQYFDWINKLIHGDFGISIVYQDSVSKIIAERLPVTLHLGILAFILSTTLGIVAGIIAAINRGKWLDSLMTLLANIGITIPIFWLGILMIYYIGHKLSWLPIQGYISPIDNFWMSTKLVIMPVICLSITSMASKARQTRSSMLEVLQQDYIRTAWSKGLKEKVIVMRHALKNSLIPVITLVGMSIPIIFGGSVLIETIFNIPGMGRLLVNAVFDQDFAIVRACFLLLTTIVVLANLIIDISYTWIDPRIRYS